MDSLLNPEGSRRLADAGRDLRCSILLDLGLGDEEITRLRRHGTRRRGKRADESTRAIAIDRVGSQLRAGNDLMIFLLCSANTAAQAGHSEYSWCSPPSTALLRTVPRSSSR